MTTSLSLFDDIVGRIFSKWDFRTILLSDDNWERYQEERGNTLRSVEIEEVVKMLSCCDPRGGFVTLLCLGCGEEKRIPFTCKSRICSRCGKRHTDEWSERLGSLLYDVPHRHVIFTVPDRLWGYFEQASALQKLLIETAVSTVRRYFRSKVGEEIVPGIVAVLHPFGSDLESKSHVHLLVTEGGITSEEKWVDVPYMSYNALRRMWQYDILTALRKQFPRDRQLAVVIDGCFRDYPKGFYLHAKRRIGSDRHQVIRYIARYIRHPAISQSRIVEYDGKNVTFVYTRDNKKLVKTLPVFEFIGNVLRHLPDKHFKVVRHFGMYARRCRGKYQALMTTLRRFVRKTIRPFSWRQNVTDLTGQDPYQCPRCGQMMVVFQFTYPQDGEMKTVGGFDWLRKRGVLRDVKKGVQDILDRIKSDCLQLSLFDPPSQPSVEQLALFPQ